MNKPVHNIDFQDFPRAGIVAEIPQRAAASEELQRIARLPA